MSRRTGRNRKPILTLHAGRRTRAPDGTPTGKPGSAEVKIKRVDDEYSTRYEGRYDGAEWTTAFSRRRHSGLGATALGPRIGHGPVELSVKGSGIPLPRPHLPSKQGKRPPDYRKARREAIEQANAAREKAKAEKAGAAP